jgi:hypothetical protein
LNGEVRERVLAAVANHDITGTNHGRRLKWWTSEHDFRRLTAAERRYLYALRDKGLVKWEGAAGYTHDYRGYYVLTRDGETLRRGTL